MYACIYVYLPVLQTGSHMCVCVCVCVCVFLYVCVCMCMNMCMHVLVFVCAVFLDEIYTCEWI